MSLPIQPQNYGLLDEFVDKFTFRNEGEFKIPKEKRELAYIQYLDIIVESKDFTLYENFKAKPPIQFYGYCVLVFQDCASLEIPIKFPRQRLFEFWNWEALRQWNELAVFWEHWQYYRRLELELAAIKSALEIPNAVEYTDDFGDTKFKEGTLLEVYVKLQSNSQFRMEYIQWQPREYVDPLGNTRSGKSNQSDSEKDTGLPKNGIQPINNTPQNPFGATPPSSGIPTLENGFFIDSSNLGNENTEGLVNRPATETEAGWYFELSYLIYGDESGKPFAEFIRRGCQEDSQLIVGSPSAPITITANGGSCTGFLTFRAFSISVTGSSYARVLNVPRGSETFDFNVRYGLLPPSISTQIDNCLVNT